MRPAPSCHTPGQGFGPRSRRAHRPVSLSGAPTLMVSLAGRMQGCNLLLLAGTVGFMLHAAVRVQTNTNGLEAGLANLNMSFFSIGLELDRLCLNLVGFY